MISTNKLSTVTRSSLMAPPLQVVRFMENYQSNALQTFAKQMCNVGDVGRVLGIVTFCDGANVRFLADELALCVKAMGNRVPEFIRSIDVDQLSVTLAFLKDCLLSKGEGSTGCLCEWNDELRQALRSLDKTHALAERQMRQIVGMGNEDEPVPQECQDYQAQLQKLLIQLHRQFPHLSSQIQLTLNSNTAISH